MSHRGIFNKSHLSLTSFTRLVPPLPPPSDLGQGVAMIITAFMPSRFFARNNQVTRSWLQTTSYEYGCRGSVAGQQGVQGAEAQVWT